MTTVESKAADTELAPTDIASLLRGYELSLRARNRSPKTLTSYVQTVLIFREFLAKMGMPTRVERLTREHVEAFIADQLQRWKPKTAPVRYGDLRQFFNWAVEEGEAQSHPMARMKPPACPRYPCRSSGTLTSVVSSRPERARSSTTDGMPPCCAS